MAQDISSFNDLLSQAQKKANMTEVEMEEYWRNKFCEEFKKHFGHEPVLKSILSQKILYLC